MNYSRYYPVDAINGEGTRCTLFVAGCEHKCRGCYNKSTWSVDAGEPFSEALAIQIVKDLNDKRIHRQGLSISGGDPLHPNNVNTVLALIQKVKAECIDKDIWLWSGYTLKELNTKQQMVVDLVDVFIDGKFEPELADAKLAFRGSSNQIIHRK